MKLTSTILLAAALLAPLHAGEILLETDPATFPMKGGALHLRARFDAMPGWTVGVGAYALDLPGLMVDLVPRNADEDWDVRIEPGIGLFLDRGFGAGGDGLTVGGQVSLQRFELEATGQEGGDAWNVLAMPRVGYHWRPFANGFYLFPWAGVGWTVPVAGDEGDYHVAPIVPFATMHIGWQFH